MISRSRSLSKTALYIDLLLLSIGFIAACISAQSLAILLERQYMFALLAIEIMFWYFSTASTSFYPNAGSRFYINQILSSVKSVFLQAMAAVFFLFIIKESLFTRNFILYYSAFSFILVLMRVTAFRKILKFRLSRSGYEKSLLIIGSGSLAQNFAKSITSRPSLGYSQIYIIGDDSLASQNYLGPIAKMEDFIKANFFDDTVIALDNSTDEQIMHILNICNKYALHTYFIPEYVRFLSNRFEFALIGDYPILSLRKEPLEEIHWRFLKRVFDLLLSVFVTVFIFSWLFPILIILQKLLSPGPVFYIQDRVGKNNQPFRCYKFRSMRITDENGKFQPVLERDERITPFGRILRKSNLDELPQILNVIKGDMSIVGPRPHAVSYDEVYEDFVEELRLRNLVKPGLTGWAQIHGLRGDVKDEAENKQRIRERIKRDVWYIENWSFMLDLQIIFLTAWQMLTGKAKGN